MYTIFMLCSFLWRFYLFLIYFLDKLNWSVHCPWGRGTGGLWSSIGPPSGGLVQKMKNTEFRPTLINLRRNHIFFLTFKSHQRIVANIMKKSLCTDKGYYKDLTDKATKRAYANLAEGRLDKHAIAQLIVLGEHCNSLKDSIIYCFKVPFKTLTKKEKKAARFAYEIAQAAFFHTLTLNLTEDNKAHATLKTVAEVRGLIKPSKQLPPSDQKEAVAGLHIHVNEDESAKYESTCKPVLTEEEKSPRQPLRLVSNG